LEVNRTPKPTLHTLPHFVNLIRKKT
jgi:hypothetical protein